MDAVWAGSRTGRPMPRVGHREFRHDLSRIMQSVMATREPVEIVNRGRAEVVMVDHLSFTELVDARARLAELESTFGLLAAALAAGAAVPSSTLEKLGIEIPLDLDALQRFQAAYPARVSRDESGARLEPVGSVATEVYAPEVDEEDEFVDIDG